MRDAQNRPPIHPADCACPRCDPQLLRGRRRTTLEIALTGLIVTAAFLIAALAVSIGTN